MSEAEDQERDDQEEAEHQVQGNHQHVKERLLGRAQVPGERRDAGEIKAIGRQQGEADEDDPEQGAQPRADGGCVDPPGAVSRGANGRGHGQAPSGRGVRARRRDMTDESRIKFSRNTTADECRPRVSGCSRVASMSGAIRAWADSGMVHERNSGPLDRMIPTVTCRVGTSVLPFGRDGCPHAAGCQGVSRSRSDHLDTRGGLAGDLLGPPGHDLQLGQVRQPVGQPLDEHGGRHARRGQGPIKHQRRSVGSAPGRKQRAGNQRNGSFDWPPRIGNGGAQPPRAAEASTAGTRSLPEQRSPTAK